jgi:hypothetical protein
MTYTIANFTKIIRRHSDGPYDTLSAAVMARTEAYNTAGRWTDGCYTIPSELEFMNAIKELRDNGYQGSGKD